MLRVYNYMATGVALTGLVAMLSYRFTGPELLQSPLMWVFVLAPLALVFLISFRINTLSAEIARLLFVVYAASVGLSLSTIFHVYTGASITRVFFISAATFGALSLWGYTTQRDLSGFGSFLFMGLIGIVITSVVNIFLKVEWSGLDDFGRRGRPVRRPHRLRYATDQGDVRSQRRRDFRRPQGRDRCAVAIPRLHQSVRHATAPDGWPALVRRDGMNQGISGSLVQQNCF